METALNLSIALRTMVILTIVIFPVQQHAFYLFVSSSISFISVTQVTKYKSSTSLGRFYG